MLKNPAMVYQNLQLTKDNIKFDILFIKLFSLKQKQSKYFQLL